jgi:hypothetical protein
MVTYVRPGFSTHAINFGQRAIKLDFSYDKLSNGGLRLHVSQLPPNPAIFAPGPALLHVVVDGIPSHGKIVMAGNGQLGQQPVSAATQLPANQTGSSSTSSGGNGKSGDAASLNRHFASSALALIIATALVTILA